MQLYPHQQTALEKTAHFNRVAYYLDMGLGKTFVGSEKANSFPEKIVLVCQKSKIDDWVNHFREHYPFTVFDLTNKKQLEEFTGTIGKCVGVINYDLVFRRSYFAYMSGFKSTFLSMVQCLLGDENISSLDLKELGDRFKTAEMFGKLANIGDDIGDEFIANPAIFKKLVTGERVSAERKGQNPFEFNNYSKLLFSANNIPRIKDKTGAVQRRLTIIPFDARFSADDPDFNPYIKHLLKTDEVMEYLINLGIAGLKRVLLNRKFTGSTKVQKAMDEYEENNNPIIGFFRECEDEEFQIENEPTNVVYKRYQEYCLANSLQPMSNIEFSKQVNRILNMRVENKWLNGKKHRIFIKNE